MYDQWVFRGLLKRNYKNIFFLYYLHIKSVLKANFQKIWFELRQCQWESFNMLFWIENNLLLIASFSFFALCFSFLLKLSFLKQKVRVTAHSVLFLVSLLLIVYFFSFFFFFKSSASPHTVLRQLYIFKKIYI